MLLLTVIDLFAQRLITANWIEPARQWPVTVTCPTAQALTTYGNIAGHLLTLHERPLVAPVDGALWPARDALRWHREQCLRS